MILSSSPAAAQLGTVEIGTISIAAGANVQQADDLGPNATFESSTGYHVGVFYEQPFALGPGTLAVRPGAVFRRVGSYDFSGLPLDNPSARLLNDRSFSVYAFDLPLDVRYRYDGFDAARPYAVAGPRVSILRAESDFDAVLEDVVIAAKAGVGVDVPIPNAFGLVVAPEVFYAHALTDAVKEDASFRFESLTGEGLTFSGVTARLHIYLPF
jgi:hypothetical protein